jgi:hypothetical protein
VAKMGSRGELTSNVIPSSKAALISVFVALLLIFFSNFSWLGIFPFILLCVKGIHASILSGLVLALIWGGYLCLLFSPLYYLSPQYIFLSLYSPLFLILLKDTKKRPSLLVIVIQYLLYEIPLLFWMNLLSFFGYRALTVRQSHTLVIPSLTLLCAGVTHSHSIHKSQIPLLLVPCHLFLISNI